MMPQRPIEDVLAFVKAYVAAGQPFPSLARISAHMRWSDYGHGRARGALMDLAGRGDIKIVRQRRWGRSRAYDYAVSGHGRNGSVGAGERS